MTNIKSLLAVFIFSYVIFLTSSWWFSASHNPAPINNDSASSTFSVMHNSIMHGSPEKPQANAALPATLPPKQPTTIQNVNDFHALNIAMAIENADERVPKVAALLTQLAEKDIQIALLWLDQQTATTEVGEYYHRILLIFIEQDIDAAGKVILTLPDFDAKRSIINDYAFKLAQQTPNGAIAWLYNISDSPYFEDAYFHLFESWLTTNTSDALNYLALHQQLPSTLKQTIVRQAANHIGKQGYKNAINSINTYPEIFQPQIAYSIVSYWPTNDIENAKQWISRLHTGTTKDKAIHSYIDVAGSSNPSSAFYLAEQINDPALSETLINRTFRYWQQIDSVQASNALKNSSALSENQKNSY